MILINSGTALKHGPIRINRIVLHEETICCGYVNSTRPVIVNRVALDRPPANGIAIVRRICNPIRSIVEMCAVQNVNAAQVGRSGYSNTHVSLHRVDPIDSDVASLNKNAFKEGGLDSGAGI